MLTRFNCSLLVQIVEGKKMECQGEVIANRDYGCGRRLHWCEIFRRDKAYEKLGCVVHDDAMHLLIRGDNGGQGDVAFGAYCRFQPVQCSIILTFALPSVTDKGISCRVHRQPRRQKGVKFTNQACEPLTETAVLYSSDNALIREIGREGSRRLVHQMDAGSGARQPTRSPRLDELDEAAFVRVEVAERELAAVSGS